MENKQEILNALLEAVKLTRAGSEVTALEFVEEEEVVMVWCKRPSGAEYLWRRANVAADSGVAMIRDVMAVIH